MGQAWFLIYPWFIFFIFFYVSEQTQTSLGQLWNDATYDVYSSKAVKTLMCWKYMNILRFILCDIIVSLKFFHALHIGKKVLD